MVTRVTHTYDPPLTFDEFEAAHGVNARRLAELAVVNEAIKHSSPITLRALMARHIGYHDLADYLMAQL